MSEYTDYLLYRTDAMTLAALQAEVTEGIGQAVIIPFSIDGAPVDEATAAKLMAEGPARKWVGLITDKLPSETRATAIAHFLVLEDFKSWRLNTVCDGKVTALQFGGDDGYGLGWFGANFDAAYLTATVPQETVDGLAACFGVPAASLTPVLAYDKPWEFLKLIGAPSIQVLDQQLAMILRDGEVPPDVASFDWNADYDE
jgi:hypothetical protein